MQKILGDDIIKNIIVSILILIALVLGVIFLPSITVAVLIFGFLIFIHELGHFLAARWAKVKVNAFAIGFGPALVSKKVKDTTYSLKVFPLGGYCAMEGEDEDNNSADSFQTKPVYKRIIICAAGAFMNIFIGFLIIMIIVASTPLASTTVAKFEENPISEQAGLKIDDKILKVDGAKINDFNDISIGFARADLENGMTLTVLRDGKQVVLQNVKLPVEEKDGIKYYTYDFKVYQQKKTFFRVVKAGFYQTVGIEKMVFLSLGDLISGKVSLNQLSGPVGTTSAIGDAVKQGFSTVVYLTVIISINLGIMNLLPLPALDGGRLVFLIIEGITRKRLNPKVEGIINGVGMLLLFALMAVVTVSDIAKFF